jgi:hypothetical protein
MKKEEEKPQNYIYIIADTAEKARKSIIYVNKKVPKETDRETKPTKQRVAEKKQSESKEKIQYKVWNRKNAEEKIEKALKMRGITMEHRLLK